MQNSIARLLESPIPLIFSSTFQKYFSWKFLLDLIQISDFKVKYFESPVGTFFRQNFQKLFFPEFHPDFVTISQFVHILFGTISDDKVVTAVCDAIHTCHI